MRRGTGRDGVWQDEAGGTGRSGTGSGVASGADRDRRNVAVQALCPPRQVVGGAVGRAARTRWGGMGKGMTGRGGRNEVWREAGQDVAVQAAYRDAAAKASAGDNSTSNRIYVGF